MDFFATVLEWTPDIEWAPNMDSLDWTPGTFLEWTPDIEFAPDMDSLDLLLSLLGQFSIS